MGKSRRLRFNTGDQRKDRILGEISDFKFKDLQAECIMRGIPFEYVVNWDHGRLADWLLNAWDNKKKKSLLKDFDDWMDALLKEKGYKKSDPLRSYKKFTGETTEEAEVKPKPTPKPKKEKKPKREKDSKYNIYKGTKKELTYHLAAKLKSQFGDKYDDKQLVKKFAGQMLVKVQKKFGDANEKSVRIWMKKALDAQ